jgi:hypothetical protein
MPLPSEEVTEKDLADKLFTAAKESLGKDFKKVKSYLKAETQKLAITLKMIIEGKISGELTQEEAAIHLAMQKVATRSVLTAAEGMSIVAAENAINSALNIVKSAVNSKIGFPLL